MVLILALVGCHTNPLPAPPVAEERAVHFEYAVTVPKLEDGPELEVFLPVPQSSPAQTISHLKVDSKVPGFFHKEQVFNNQFWSASVSPDDTPLRILLSFDVRRSQLRADLSKATQIGTDVEDRFLAPTTRVPVGDVGALKGPLQAIRAARTDASPLATVRSIFDWLVTELEYKKVGTGWGNGDTFWACSSRYGNCTDFHSVFLSLARTEGIPARFEMGFPIPLERAEGEIKGYHCWVQAYIPGVGWIPIDASEAAKHPDQRESLFASQPADRVQFTVGRDLRLGERHRGEPLNYFIYPYAERDGVAFDGLTASFHYQQKR